VPRPNNRAPFACRGCDVSHGHFISAPRWAVRVCSEMYVSSLS